MGASAYSHAVAESSRVEAPFARNALELRGATVLEVDTRAGGEVPDDAGDQYLAGSGLRRDPGADVDRDAFHSAADELNLAGVNAGADFEAELGDGIDRAMSAGDGPRRTVEGGEESVAGAANLPAAVAGKLGADGGVVGVQQGAPAAVTELGRARGGLDDVREEDGREDTLGRRVDTTLGEEALHPVGHCRVAVNAGIRRGQLEDLGVWDALGEVEAALPVAVLVHDQRGDGDGREHLADVGLHQHPQEPGGRARAGGEALVVHVPVLELRIADMAREVLAELAELVVAIAPLEPRLAHPPVPL